MRAGHEAEAINSWLQTCSQGSRREEWRGWYRTTGLAAWIPAFRRSIPGMPRRRLSVRRATTAMALAPATLTSLRVRTIRTLRERCDREQ